VGGAILPELQGILADHIGIHHAFFISGDLLSLHHVLRVLGIATAPKLRESVARPKCLKAELRLQLDFANGSPVSKGPSSKSIRHVEALLTLSSLSARNRSQY